MHSAINDYLLIGIFITQLTVVVLSYGYALKVKKDEALWKLALDSAGDGVWDWNIQNNQARFSNSYQQLFGFSVDDINANLQNWYDRIHPDDLASKKEAVNHHLLGKIDKYIHEHRVICKDKSVKWVLSRGMVVERDKAGNPLRMVGTHVDITERKRNEHKHSNLAHFDALTNLPNRKLFNDRLKLALANAKRTKKMLAVLFIDLDLFKEINDQYGHKVGDMVLKKSAQRLLSCVRETDTVARLGGDEFVILISNIESELDVHKVTDKLLECAAKPIEIVKSNDTSQIIDLKLRNLQVSASIGVAIYPQHGANEKTLIINADAAMYLAKKSGKNQVKFFDDQTIVTYDI